MESRPKADGAMENTPFVKDWSGGRGSGVLEVGGTGVARAMSLPLTADGADSRLLRKINTVVTDKTSKIATLDIMVIFVLVMEIPPRRNGICFLLPII